MTWQRVMTIFAIIAAYTSLLTLMLALEAFSKQPG